MEDAKKVVRTQYIAEFKFRGKPGVPEKWNVVLHSSRTGKLMYSLEEAKYEVERMKREDGCDRRNSGSTVVCGSIGVSTQHYSEYDIVAYRISKREVTPYETVCEEVVAD